jgi:hypothetical protein
MNPPTKGHEKLVETVLSIEGDHVIHLSHSSNSKRNPLSYEDKVFYATEAFGDVIVPSDSRTVVESLKSLARDYPRVVMVVGGDRVEEFSDMFEKYNESEFGFESWSVVDAGARRADSDSIDGVSASMVREACISEDADRVLWGLPDSLAGYADEIAEKVRAVYTAEESIKTVQSLKRRHAREVLKKAVKRVK